MAATVIDLANADDQRDIVHQTVQALAEGKLVALPTETVYGLAARALHESAVERLAAIKGRDNKPFALAVKSYDDALDYVPVMPPVGARLARRCWPGPVTLVMNDDHADSVVQQLPPSVRRRIAPDGTIGLRVPAHPLFLHILRLSAGPLVLTSANLPGEPESITGADALKSLGDAVDLVVDDGPCRFGQASTVVRVHDASLEVLREGVINRNALRRLSSYIVLVVCTGNTCRSPMGELLMKRRLAEGLKCDLEALEDRGILVMSAGIAAMNGAAASPESVAVMTQRGLDLQSHESQPVNDRLIRFADLILTMTNGHREALLSQWPSAAERTFTICVDGQDVADPIGGTMEHYEQCAQQIDDQLGHWVSRFDWSEFLTRLEPGE